MKATLFSALFAAMFAVAAPGFAQEAPAQPNRYLAALPTPAERFEIKGMLVERHGSGPRALILVPGLSSGAWVWQQTVRDFAATNTVYVVTLPGFDGRPAVAGEPFDNARDALAELIVSRKLVKPVVIGHSIGAALSYALAQEHPDRVGGVIGIDGLPVFPRTENMTPEQRAAMADGARTQMSALSGPAFEANQQQYMRGIGMVDMGKADDAAKLSARSDPQAVGAYAGALMARDLRPGMSRISAPVLLLAPYYAPDAPYIGNISKDDKVAYYRALMGATPKLEVEAIDNARHFPMIDQPQATSDAIRRFLKSL
ncbi:alpha/beta hydrolase [Massilia sp. G4R7]|uniref:Alpha/beta hydrolase n=1 Tax=Massilia phyllostachyos TaxID=2898585 RepID=A0ABS8Q4G1_9BURK|nr:alpha/beta hydrolase [Massilia phyllostachyos]MCD2516630.1 alpha/beta hydrolase [Massilia phyllostachyos]